MLTVSDSLGRPSRAIEQQVRGFRDALREPSPRAAARGRGQARLRPEAASGR
ncbi:hypothetical protein [Methylobacterium gregans]|uniref:hypothetical protein n=1 Tax=Methylobacterium gregans TaxID=374424 RepID=UPI00278D6205|nr:hypothetical protein [Methylobacterium gregans]MDQ0523166.1 hypothetical protein [Methylobacterium gregans]